jgi:hypothetical protein
VLARLARVFLVVALLAGWQAALLHPLQHADSHGALIHLGDGRTAPAQSDSSKLCDALAALTACAPHAPLAFAAPAAEHHAFRVSEARPRAAEAPPFLAQGPPALL